MYMGKVHLHVLYLRAMVKSKLFFVSPIVLFHFWNFFKIKKKITYSLFNVYVTSKRCFWLVTHFLFEAIPLLIKSLIQTSLILIQIGIDLYSFKLKSIKTYFFKYKLSPTSFNLIYILFKVLQLMQN